MEIQHIARLRRGSTRNALRIVLASALAFGLVETSSAASCLVTDVTLDGMVATSCGWTDGSSNDNVGGMPQPDSWSVNVDNAGDTSGDLVWNAYYKAEIEESTVPPSQTSEWSAEGGNVADGEPIDLQLTAFTGTVDDPFSSGTFTVNGLSATGNGEILVVLKDGNRSGSVYHWYLFLGKVGGDLMGEWDTTEPFGGKNLSHMTVYEIGVTDNGGPPQLIPVPAAVWLFGSGLLGLVGVARRKKS